MRRLRDAWLVLLGRRVAVAPAPGGTEGGTRYLNFGAPSVTVYGGTSANIVA